jgi:LuxR family quorum-sensing transcriptional regulator LasR
MNSLERFPDGATDNAGEAMMVGVQLTAKEHEVLGWAALGKSAWEISRILGRTEAAVNYHLGNIRRKFGVHSIKAALVKAIQQRVILLE